VAQDHQLPLAPLLTVVGALGECQQGAQHERGQRRCRGGEHGAQGVAASVSTARRSSQWSELIRHADSGGSPRSRCGLAGHRTRTSTVAPGWDRPDSSTRGSSAHRPETGVSVRAGTALPELRGSGLAEPGWKTGKYRQESVHPRGVGRGPLGLAITTPAQQTRRRIQMQIPRERGPRPRHDVHRPRATSKWCTNAIWPPTPG
jgi:hypothetical protein